MSKDEEARILRVPRREPWPNLCSKDQTQHRADWLRRTVDAGWDAERMRMIDRQGGPSPTCSATRPTVDTGCYLLEGSHSEQIFVTPRRDGHRPGDGDGRQPRALLHAKSPGNCASSLLQSVPLLPHGLVSESIHSSDDWSARVLVPRPPQW